VGRLRVREMELRGGDRSEPECGLEPRLEALPQFGKSPSSSRGVRAKALTPPALRTPFLALEG